MLRIIPAFLLAIVLCAAEKEPRNLALTGDIDGVHDPVVIKERDTYYLFSTGGRPRVGAIPIRTSKNVLHWTLAGYVFDKLPDWTTREIPKAVDAWAPDISFHGGRFRLYYAVSTFGSGNSVIGLATNATLDPKSPEYRWVDEGMVLRSYQGKDDWNAIDPNLFDAGERGMWLVWGSYWSGIKMRRVDPATSKVDRHGRMYSLAGRPRTPPIDGSIEAPFLIQHEGYYYLFVSFDHCCRGVRSDYNIRVGRARAVTGPYVDRDGKRMIKGGGTLVLEGTTGAWRGPGHEAVLRETRGDYLLFHAYSGTTGRQQLHISEMVWENGWPRVAALP